MIKRTDGSDMKLPISPRDNEIHIAQQTKQENLVKDTIILQKINKAHRVAFKDRFPGQIEHCMRLTTERLQGLLTKKPSDPLDVNTWAGTPEEINALTHALYHLTIMNQHYPYEEE